MAVKEGFFKVSQQGGSFVTATFFNPETKEEYSELVRDYDYIDKSRDNDELYDMVINEKAAVEWKHHHGEILGGDKVRVVKGRKVPIGTEAMVVDKYPVYDGYHRLVADYLKLDNGMKTNVNNCVRI